MKKMPVHLPTISLLAKLGSLVVHTEELLSADGHHYDKSAIESIIRDEEVTDFINQMQKIALVPVKRKK